MSEELFKNDLALYRKMREPYPNSDAADAACKAFADDLAELRKKHKVQDLLVLLGGSFITKDDDDKPDECQFLMPLFWGSYGEAEPMAAYLYAHHQAERAKVVERSLMAGKKKGTPRP